MPGMWCRSALTPVMIDAAHTGVTDGNAATQPATYCPFLIRCSSIGAAPAATARSSIAGASASMTHSTSFLRLAAALTTASAPQHAQSRVLVGAARARSRSKPYERGDEHVPEWVQRAHERGSGKCGRVEVNRERLARRAIGE